MRKVFYIILLVIWMGAIFLFSNRSGLKSTDDSKSFINKTIITIYKLFDHDATEDKLEEIVDIFNYPIRKLAHFTEYFILGILMFFCFKEFDNKDIFLMILFCFLYACSDEFHQLFVIGRDGSFKDVLIDTLGSSFSIVVFGKKKK